MGKKNRKQRIEEKLITLYNPVSLEVRDDSSDHKGHFHLKDGQKETHFFIKMTTSNFSGLSKLEMHKEVYKTLDNEFKLGLHALELELSSI